MKKGMNGLSENWSRLPEAGFVPFWNDRIPAMLKPLRFRFPAHKTLALYDWVPFNAMSDQLFVVGKVQRTGFLSRIFKTKTVAVNLTQVLQIGEIYSLLYKGPIVRDRLILQSKKAWRATVGLDVIRDIPTK